MSDNKGLGRFFKGDDLGDSTSSNSGSKNESEKTIAELQARITELEGSSGRNSLIDLDEDQLTQIAAEDAGAGRGGGSQRKQGTQDKHDFSGLRFHGYIDVRIGLSLI